MVHLTLLPNWNSLDSVRAAHSKLEAGGLVFFTLLVFAEVLAHVTKEERRKHVFDSFGLVFFAIAILCEIGGFRYGNRNDELSGNLITSLDNKAKDAKDAAESAVDKSEQAKSIADLSATSATRAGTDANSAITEAESAAGMVTSLESESKVLTARLLSTSQRLAETERGVKAVSPRRLDSYALSTLKGLAPLGYILTCDNDLNCVKSGEPQSLAFDLEIELNALGWQRLIPARPLPQSDPSYSVLSDLIAPAKMTDSGVDAGCGSQEKEGTPCVERAHQIVDALNELGISSTYIPRSERLPTQVLLIAVRLLPSAYERARIKTVWEQSKQVRALREARKPPSGP